MTPHHQSGRRADGTDPDDGVTSGCWACHLNLIHILSSLYVTGRAPNQLTWTIGPAEARFVVEGREVIRLPRSANAA